MTNARQSATNSHHARLVSARRFRAAFLAPLIVLACSGGARDDTGDRAFAITAPIACKEIRGYENFDELPGAALTSDEKLLVYYRPLHYKSEKVGDHYEAHFTQDGRIRPKGQSKIVWTKDKLLDYVAKASLHPNFIYIRNTISIKGLKPGDYEFEIILRDEVGQSAPAIRKLPFKIVPPQASPEPEKGEPGSAGSP